MRKLTNHCWKQLNRYVCMTVISCSVKITSSIFCVFSVWRRIRLFRWYKQKDELKKMYRALQTEGTELLADGWCTWMYHMTPRCNHMIYGHLRYLTWPGNIADIRYYSQSNWGCHGRVRNRKHWHYTEHYTIKYLTACNCIHYTDITVHCFSVFCNCCYGYLLWPLTFDYLVSCH